MKDARGWYSRGYLPHIDAGSQPQFLTWRLRDSLPAVVVDEWRREVENLPEEDAKREMFQRVERYLDAGHGACTLKNPLASKIVQDCLVFGHAKKYELHHWAIMPNHVHLLLTPLEGHDFRSILRPLKSYSALQINRTLGLHGHFGRLTSLTDSFGIWCTLNASLAISSGTR